MARRKQSSQQGGVLRAESVVLYFLFGTIRLGYVAEETFKS